MEDHPPNGGSVFPEGMPDLQALLEQASQMQQRIIDAQAELADARITGSAGGGLVTATVSGAGELVSLDISPEVCDPDDTETLADLVVAAIRNASAAAEQRAGAELGDLTGSFDTSMLGSDPLGPDSAGSEVGLGFRGLPDPGAPKED
jgi:DNA-binding YbaB/EbfC family protein